MKNTLTPRELELKNLIHSLNEYAKEAIKVSATKSIGLSILNSVALSDAEGFLSMRENWLETSRTANLPSEMRVELEDYLKAAQLLVKAKDSLDSSFECRKSLRGLKDSLEYVEKGHVPKGFFVRVCWENFTEVPEPEHFNNKWSDLTSIEVGFQYLHRVLSDSDYKFCITASGTNMHNVINDLCRLVKMSFVEQFILSEGKQASETDVNIWRNIYRLLRKIKNLL